MKESTKLVISFVFGTLVFTLMNQGLLSGELADSVEDDIVRVIHAQKIEGRFPRLAAARNTSIQKAPAPILAAQSEKLFGKAKLTRCWLNLDELWNYRTREYRFNHIIGVHQYDGIKEKHQETWGTVSETDIGFYDYLTSFGQHSEHIILTIRRYERDVLDGKLGITMEDWKEVFKNAVIHYRKLCANLRYVEVCNEYSLKTFIGCSPEQYYDFYKLGYQAVNEANEELGLEGGQRILVGGPVVTGNIMEKLDSFLKNYSSDTAPGKRLDFVSWHEYDQDMEATVYREQAVNSLLELHGIQDSLPMFVSEHDPVHGSLRTPEINLVNAAKLVKTLYFSSVFSPGMTLIPWVLYHDAEIQNQFMWFHGPNRADTKSSELRLLPIGCSMKLLSLHKDWKIEVENDVARDDLVLASSQADGLAVQVINYGKERSACIQIDQFSSAFGQCTNERIHCAKYLINEPHTNDFSNSLAGCDLKPVDERILTAENGRITLTQFHLNPNGIVMWVLRPEEETGKCLKSPSDSASDSAQVCREKQDNP